tara:strand:+ start:970 stop:1509 length:540 start_codon:yes stop_codon:yes gene_type:complete
MRGRYASRDLIATAESEPLTLPNKLFTVEEANATVPLLEDVFERMDGKRAALFAQHQKLQMLEVMWGEQIRKSENPDHAEFNELRAAFDGSIDELDQFVTREIRDRGLRFPPGGLENGLIDFPTTYEGRWVFLCWQRGEPQVSYWHEIEAGFRGRQEIAAEHVIAMGKDDADGALPGDM